MSSTGSRLPDGVAEARLEPKKVRALWRDWDGRPNRIEDTPALRIGLAASFTVNPLVPYLGGHLLAADIKSAIEVGPFNQLFQVCLDHASAFHRKPDVLVLLWRIEELMEKEITAFLHGDQNAAKRALSKLGEFRQALGSLRSAFAGTIIVNLPPFPATLPVHSLELTNPGTLGHVTARAWPRGVQ
jgi:hypothetical protein